MNGGSTIDRMPECPVVSRFVAPWDTSGWYYVAPGFCTGERLYSNVEICAGEVPPELCGGEYIVVYDSFSEGFDDKQGANFVVERPARVFIALDCRADGAFLKGFLPSEMTMTATDGTRYRIFSRGCAAGEKICLPDARGEFHHYVTVVRALDTDAPQALREPLDAPKHEKRHVARLARWYWQETFLTARQGAPAEEYEIDGVCEILPREGCAERLAVRIRGGASLKRRTNASGREECEAVIRTLRGRTRVSFCGAQITLGKGKAEGESGRALGQELGERFRLRFLRDGGWCEIWLNCRKAAVARCTAGEQAVFALQTDADGEAELQRLTLRDRTDIPMDIEDFETARGARLASENACAKVYPFPDWNCLRLEKGGRWSRAFDAISKEMRLEITARPETDAFCVLLEARDAAGRIAARAAMYKNNLFASFGREWKQIYGGHISGMYYPCGNWYRLAMNIDLVRGTYDLYIDGALCAKGFPLAADAVEIAQAGGMTCGGMLRVSKLKVYDRTTFAPDELPPVPIMDARAFGARGDGRTLDTAAIARAVEEAARVGGAVLLRDGVFLSGEIRLRSDVTFWIDRTATLLGTQDHACYPLRTPCSSLCANRQLGRGLLYAEREENIMLTGGGTVDGNGCYRFKMNDPIANRQRDARPDQAYLACCDGVTIENLDFVNAAFWSVVPLSSRNVQIERLNVDCRNTPNRDGIDPVDCVDMTIRDCCIIAGDDGLCMKSSDDMGCRNIDIEDMVIQSLASGIKFGTDSYHSLENVSVRNCILKNINRCAVSLEATDGARVENVRLENLEITDVGAAAYLTVGSRGRRPQGAFPERRSAMRDVRFAHMRFEKPYQYCHSRAGEIHEIMIVGQSTEQRIEEISFADCELRLPGGAEHQNAAPEPLNERYPEYDQHGLSAGHAFTLRYVQDARFENCRITLEKRDIRPMLAAFDCEGIVQQTPRNK
ncbi:MAG: glycosyl hydrolase family 28 protein [Candidatus Aphodomonas sp.]|nr:glycosyl hydrolase family 28 protein [Candidatus Aphodomonas sp.]